MLVAACDSKRYHLLDAADTALEFVQRFVS